MNTGTLGGDSSWYERLRLLERHIEHLQAVDLGLRAQCRCGQTLYSKWRGRWVCRRCGRWVKRFAHVEAEHRGVATDRILTGADPKGDARLVAAIEGGGA